MSIGDQAQGAVGTPAAAATAAQEGAPARRLRFSGDGQTYFGIWIVNILFSVLTLGVYSAWAKVRTRRYFYGNTTLGADAFDYHADPIAILKGRLIAVTVIGLLYFLDWFSYDLYGLAIVALLLAAPWILNRSMRFNARMTSWRNVRFDFHGDYWPAFNAMLVMPALAAISFGLLLPVATRVRQNYILNRLELGTAPFKASIYDRQLYAGLLYAVLTFVAGLAILALLASLFISVFGLDRYDVDIGMRTYSQIGVYLGLLIFFMAAVVYRAVAYRVAMNATSLKGAGRLWSGLSPARMLWITVSNTLAIIATLGLFYPWARVRSWRYKTEQTGIFATGDLGAFVDSQTAAGKAYASEYADLADVDIGF